MNPTAIRTVNRAANIAGSYGHTRSAPDRVDALALAKLSVEHVRQEIDLFIRYIYQQKQGGRWLYIGVDGQIPSGVWTPWGSSGKSSLTKSQRLALRTWLQSQHRGRTFAPFFYRPATRRWYVDLLRYDSEVEALRWLDRAGLDAHAWLNLTDGLPRR